MHNMSDAKWPTIFVDLIPNFDRKQRLVLKEYTLDVYDISYLHYHRYLELAYCCEGEGICYVEGQSFPFKKGDAQVIFPYQRHLSKSSKHAPSKWKWFTLDPVDLLYKCGYTDIHHIHHWLSHEMAVFGIINDTTHARLADSLKRLFFPPATMEPTSEKTWLCGNILSIIIELREASKDRCKLTLSAKHAITEISPAIEYIENQLAHGSLPAIETAAKHCSMSYSSFLRKFDYTMGISPKQYITVVRMRKARKLLLGSSMSILSISEALGYTDLSSFNRGFKKYHNLSPSEYRSLYT